MLRERLRELRDREATLERALGERGIDALAIGPKVPGEMAIDPTPRPGEFKEPERKLSRLSPRPSLFQRAVAALRGRRR